MFLVLIEMFFSVKQIPVSQGLEGRESDLYQRLEVTSNGATWLHPLCSSQHNQRPEFLESQRAHKEKPDSEMCPKLSRVRLNFRSHIALLASITSPLSEGGGVGCVWGGG